jgi:hypothetical protein
VVINLVQCCGPRTKNHSSFGGQQTLNSTERHQTADKKHQTEKEEGWGEGEGWGGRSEDLGWPIPVSYCQIHTAIRS